MLGIFIAANEVMHESWLLAVTLMGMWLANMKGVDVRHILHFKENLSVLLISGLFILLAARLDLNAMIGLGPLVLVLLLIIQFIARPLERDALHPGLEFELARTSAAVLDSPSRDRRGGRVSDFRDSSA